MMVREHYISLSMGMMRIPSVDDDNDDNDDNYNGDDDDDDTDGRISKINICLS